MKFGDKGGYLFLGSMAPRDRKAILLGLAAVVPAFIWVFGVRPYRAALADVRESYAVETGRLTRELALIQASESLPAAIEEAVIQAEAVQSRLVRGSSAILAEAEVTDFLEEVAFQSRVLLEEIRSGELNRGEEPPPGLSLVRLHLSGESDLEGVLGFLDRIERSDLLLRVRGLALEPQMARAEGNGRDNSPRPALPTGVVEFQLILDGFASLTELER